MFEETGCHVQPMQKAATPEETLNLVSIRLAISGMGCPNCAARIRNSLLLLQGVVAADVDYLSGFGVVQYNPGMVDTRGIKLAVAAAGSDGRHEYAAQTVN